MIAISLAAPSLARISKSNPALVSTAPITPCVSAAEIAPQPSTSVGAPARCWMFVAPILLKPNSPRSTLLLVDTSSLGVQIA